jgi:hypothetical protein
MTFDASQEELLCYTLAHRGPGFIHQHAVDAITAQQADERTKPIALAFALIGLCLYIEKGFTGKQVQQVHQRLAARKRAWPTFPLPSSRGSITAADVLTQAPGPARDRAIQSWCAVVWAAYRDSHAPIAKLLPEYLASSGRA